MNSFFKKIFGQNKGQFFSMPFEQSFDNTIEFTNFDHIYNELTDYLNKLRDTKENIIIENHLKKRICKKHSDIKDLIAEIKNDFEYDFRDITSEFKGEPLGFKYYLGQEILCIGSVEIVKKIYHKERDDIGNVFHSLIIKYNKGKYYYWKW